MVVFCDDNDKVQFIRLNQISYTVLLIMHRDHLTVRQIMKQIANTHPSLDIGKIMSMCSIFIAGLYDDGVLIILKIRRVLSKCDLAIPLA
ncbi:hypothetical protein [Legionella quateirensis]|uniref:Uncharacterized protein conserved in bacteria n=1 Tax=Legionella quateirensis TaxID=45072 RepID=A0A378PA70_9GAMM|nr:hypothetical protein Lqua_0328 [Legionella quateirensis]STY83060.1 Uncharacterized protein conserved in bacteria [Legionella quateirensis]